MNELTESQIHIIHTYNTKGLDGLTQRTTSSDWEWDIHAQRAFSNLKKSAEIIEKQIIRLEEISDE